MMSSYTSFKNVGDTLHPEGRGAGAGGNFSLAGQSPVCSLTFDELQSSFIGAGKDFGSMNMDDLFKSIWTADGIQLIPSFTGYTEDILVATGNLHKQGSLMLPRMLSQKTVDEVLKELIKEGDKNGTGSGGESLPRKQGTLGEMTVLEFLSKAGVVGEVTHPNKGPNNGGFYNEISQENNSNTGLTFGIQQPTRNHASLNNQIIENNDTVPQLSTHLSLKACSVMSKQLQQQQPLFPKPSTLVFATPSNILTNPQLASPGTKGPNSGRTSHSTTNSLVQSRVIQSGAMGMADIAPRATTAASESPKTRLIPTIIPKIVVGTSSISPSPYAFNESACGRKPSGTLEKVVERRHKRMIKNRESAARSRARKQAYTLELEEEVAKLKRVIEDLQKKQQIFKDMQKSQMEKTKFPWGSKQECLRRTMTGPW